MLDEHMTGAGSGLQELNTILNSTQTKINKLKGVCGSLTNFFRVKLTARDNLSYSSEQSYVGQTNYDKDFVVQSSEDIASINQGLGPNDNEMTPRQDGGKQDGGDMSTTLKELEEMQNKVTSQVSKLDQLLKQAENAEMSLSSQNKQMRSFLR
ncbi:unnamed protein product [Diatraea saccharalis]|uniref:Uncharacterized protein n=1 Tax=Diatraea saccharalis TaxID=40085 RepID=A0A9P0C874_9NEOP|nr:unnamed protein product [Diatraea saccharalis]